MTNEALLEFAIRAKDRAISPTGYHCGAALVSETGRIYTGCNLGSEDGIFNICAERLAICKMLSEGERTFTKIAVVGGMGDRLTFTTPCGVCRQLISEFGQEIEVVCGYKEDGELKQKVYHIKDLLPESFQF
ncbi:MAG: cytidine deaminase [Clostridia bacterium]|nr:cytidine deaminase [Clostridia bacterium]